MVDEDWNIKYFIDLEFRGSWPIEFLHPPDWLGGASIDTIDATGFAPSHARFLEFIKEQEELQNWENGERLSNMMQKSWENGAFWATLSLMEPVAFTEIFYDRILKDHYGFSDEDLSSTNDEFFARLWRPDFEKVAEQKVKDYVEYVEKLKAAFISTA